MTKIYMLHYSNRENNPAHHGHCLYSSDSVSMRSFCCPKGLVHFGYTNVTRGFPLALVAKRLEGCPCHVKLLTLDQKPESSPVDVF